jgi:hypothetical protein
MHISILFQDKFKLSDLECGNLIKIYCYIKVVHRVFFHDVLTEIRVYKLLSEQVLCTETSEDYPFI